MPLGTIAAIVRFRMSPFFVFHVVPIVLFVSLCAVGLAVVRRRIRGTTLTAAWCWAIVALAAIAACELLLACLDSAGDATTAGFTSRLRFVAAVTTVAPTMAVLGAKRPQHRAWQLIVQALLVVLMLPAVQAALFAPGPGPLELHAAWRWFLAILIAVGVVNYLPTRTWPAALAYGLAQTWLLAGQLPLTDSLPNWDWSLLGLGMMTIAVWLAALRWPHRRWPHRRRTAGNDRLWLDFRDAYGLVWALRVQERFNATAAQNGWHLRLTWGGIVSTDAARPQVRPLEGRSYDDARAQEQLDERVTRSLTSLLRRFVSQEWIACRLGTS